MNCVIVSKKFVAGISVSHHRGRRWHELLPALLVFSSILSAARLPHAAGLIYEDPRSVPELTEVVETPPAPGAPAVDAVLGTDLSPQMPPVGDQGNQLSCVAWAVGYYHKTHTEWLEHHWNVSDPRFQFSPAFVYSQINGGADSGAYFSAAARLICEQGCASLADCPYDQRDFGTWPSESAYARAVSFRGDAGFWIQTADTTGLRQIKQRLLNGATTCLGIYLWDNFYDIGHYRNMYCVADRQGFISAGHAVTIVGYNDTLATNDGRGAFKIVNSWGTNWGASGYFWMSYEAVMDYRLSQLWALYVTDRTGYQPTMLARVRISHPARDRVGIRIGAGSSGMAMWSEDYRRFRRPVCDRAFPAGNLVFDMTGGESCVTQGMAESVFVSCSDDSADAKTGNIESFSCELVPAGRMVGSSDPPVPIPDDGTPAAARAAMNPPTDRTCLGFDNGLPFLSWFWGANCGWGGAFRPVTYPSYPVGASIRFYDRSWPNPGSDRIRLRVLSDDGSGGSPGSVLYESGVLQCSRGDWKYFPLPGDQIGPVRSGCFYLFYVQADEYPYCPAILVDDNGITSPNPWWFCDNGSYLRSGPSIRGDLMIRATVGNSTSGVAELPITAPSRITLSCPAFFRDRMQVRYTVNGTGAVDLAVLDPSGRRRRTLRHCRQDAGSYEVDWAPGPGIAPGLYFLRLKAGSRQATAKVVRVVG